MPTRFRKRLSIDNELSRAAREGRVRDLHAIVADNPETLRDRPVPAALFSAIEAGHVESLRTLMDMGARLPEWGSTELHIACVVGSEAVVSFLISPGENINSVEMSGHTPLMHAARKGHLNLVKLLIEHGANLRMRNKK